MRRRPCNNFNQRCLREAASLIPDFPLYQSLCSHTISMAWESDRTTGKRTTHHLKMRRSRLVSYFASCQRLHADLIIPALNRAGDYACVVVPKKDRGPQWSRFVEAGKCLVFIRTSWSVWLRGLKSG